MIQAAEAAPPPSEKNEEEKRIMPLQSPASDILEMWDERLHQQKDNLPRQMVFDTSMEFVADVGVVFAGEPRPAGAYESGVTLSMGYTIAQQTELAAIVAYHRMRHAALLLENMLVFKPRGAPPHASGTVTMVRVLDAAQDLLAAIRVQRHVLKKKMPLSLSNYSYGKRIFDAGVVFGVLSSMSAARNFERNTTRAAAEGLGQCIELLKDLEGWLRIKDGVPEPASTPSIAELPPPRRVLEELAQHAGIKIVDGVVESIGPKRKRQLFEMEDTDSSWDGLILPYMMGGWVVGKSPPPTSWLGPQPEIPSPAAPAVAPAVVTSAPTLVPANPAITDEHRAKRSCRTHVGGISHYPTEMLGPLSGDDESSTCGDAKAKRRSPENARPTSARPIIAVRARVAETMKRPKRKVPPAPPAADEVTVKKSKSESPSIDEDDESRFAYHPPEENQEYPYQPSYIPSQLQPAPESKPGIVQTPMVVERPPPAESIAGSDTPVTPQYAPTQQPGYAGEVWNEPEGSNMFGQSMLQAHPYTATGLMLGQPSESYLHHHHAPPPPPPQSQPQSSQPAPHPMPAQYLHQQPLRHEYSHSHMHFSHVPQSYSGYSNVDSNPPPHLVIDAGLNGAPNQGSQPSSAVTMSETSGFYSHSGQMPVQSIAPSALLQQAQQETYGTNWNSTQDYYRRY